MSSKSRLVKEYDAIAIGTGSVMEVVVALLRMKPKAKVAVIDKDEPGGICLTRGCIPSKILLYPAELVRLIEKARELGVEAEIKRINFKFVMDRVRRLIGKDIEEIKEGLSGSENIDYYRAVAEFVAPYTLKVGDQQIRSNMIFLGTGSRPFIPPVKGLAEAGYLTSDTILELEELPKSVAIIGGGYIAAEYGHFLSAMGSDVTIVGRNPRFLPDEEPEISALAKKELGGRMRIFTGYEAKEVLKEGSLKRLVAYRRDGEKKLAVTAEEILVAAGRASNSNLLHPERAGIKVDEEGWIVVDEYLQTSVPNIWALGDANGRHQFKHVANYEAEVVIHNALLGHKMKVDYHAVPHAVFTYPEVASVGMKQAEAIRAYGEEDVLIGFYRYEDTAKGLAMDVKDYFVKVLVQKSTGRLLGAHIIGPYASILIHEVIPLMYTEGQSYYPIVRAMHIHPALSEVVERAFGQLMTVHEYSHLLEHHLGLTEAARLI